MDSSKQLKLQSVTQNTQQVSEKHVFPSALAAGRSLFLFRTAQF